MWVENKPKTVVARSEREAIQPVVLCRTWIASRSLSSGARSRDPLARNDVNLPLKYHGIDHDAAPARAVEQHRVEVEAHHSGRGIEHQFTDPDDGIGQRLDI